MLKMRVFWFAFQAMKAYIHVRDEEQSSNKGEWICYKRVQLL